MQQSKTIILTHRTETRSKEKPKDQHKGRKCTTILYNLYKQHFAYSSKFTLRTNSVST